MNTRVNWERLRPSPEIESLGRLTSPEEIKGELGKVARNFGNITAIMPLPTMQEQGGNQCAFLVCFEKTLDAITASRNWHCLLFGFTSVIVAIRLPEKLQETTESCSEAIN